MRSYPTKIIIQRICPGDSAITTFRLVAYDVESGRIYRAVDFESEEKLVASTTSVVPRLRNVLNSLPDQAGIYIIFDEVLQLRDRQLSDLGVKP